MAGIPMLIKIGPEFQCLQKEGHNSNVGNQKDRAGIQGFERIGPEFQW